MNHHREPLFVRFARGLLAVFYPKIQLEGLENLPEEPSILVGNHCHAHGPIISETRMDFPHYTWCVAAMLHREEVEAYAFQDFWSKKPASIQWFYRLISKVIPVPVSFLLSNVPTIPVYHDNRCVTTFRKTMDALQQGNHIVIFPEHEVPYNGIVWEFQDKFIDTARFYYKKCGKCLSFVPMYLAPNLRKVFFGAPVRFDPAAPIEAERKRICTYLMDSVTGLAAAQPEHIVIPYPNIPKRDYPRNTACEVAYETETL